MLQVQTRHCFQKFCKQCVMKTKSLCQLQPSQFWKPCKSREIQKTLSLQDQLLQIQQLLHLISWQHMLRPVLKLFVFAVGIIYPQDNSDLWWAYGNADRYVILSCYLLRRGPNINCWRYHQTPKCFMHSKSRKQSLLYRVLGRQQSRATLYKSWQSPKLELNDRLIGKQLRHITTRMYTLSLTDGSMVNFAKAPLYETLESQLWHRRLSPINLHYLGQSPKTCGWGSKTLSYLYIASCM